MPRPAHRSISDLDSAIAHEEKTLEARDYTMMLLQQALTAVQTAKEKAKEVRWQQKIKQAGGTPQSPPRRAKQQDQDLNQESLTPRFPTLFSADRRSLGATLRMLQTELETALAGRDFDAVQDVADQMVHAVMSYKDKQVATWANLVVVMEGMEEGVLERSLKYVEQVGEEWGDGD